MDQQFLAAFRSLSLADFAAKFEPIVAGRLWARYKEAREVDELQLYLLSLTDEQQILICRCIKEKMHPYLVEVQGPVQELVAFRNFLLDENCHHIIKSDIVVRPDNSGYADWAIVTDTAHYHKWIQHTGRNKAA